MNRRALQMLMGSGRFLCFDVRAPYQAIKAAAAERATEETAQGTQDNPPKKKADQGGPLFDLGTLNLGIFFKEVAPSEDDPEDVTVSTRVFFPYNDQDIMEGGESTSAAPSQVFDILSKRGAVKAGETFTPHDQKVLEVVTSLPTFDPFLLLSRRRELEEDRGVNGSYFEISEEDWANIRRPVMRRISMLVAKANTGTAIDVYDQYQDRSEETAEDAQRRIMTSAVVDSIWRGEASQGAKLLIKSFRLEEAETTRILFAWKGINYYEYQYDKYQPRFIDFFRWLGSNESLPRDIDSLQASAVDRFNFRRDRARKLIRATHATVTKIIKDYNDSFAQLVDDDQPKHFQGFLAQAPKNFLTVGLAIGVLAHTATAWSDVTQEGRRPSIKAADLEPFYDFIIAVNGQDFYAVR